MTEGSLDLLASAPALVGALERSGVLAGVRAARQALSAAAAEERAAQESAVQAEASLEEVTARLEIAGRAIRSQGEEMAAAWGGVVAQAAESLREACTAAERLAAVGTLAERLGFEGHLPWVDVDVFSGFVDDPQSTVVFTGVDLTALGPPDTRLNDLGPQIERPVTREAAAALLVGTANPELLDVDPHGGIHVSIDRGLYRHHGILLGEGWVAHFAGEPLAKSQAAIRVDSVASFMGSSDPETLRRHIPERVGRPPVAVYVPNLVALRAASMVGMNGYDLFHRNCEHFAAWTQMGAMLSGQVDQLWNARQVASVRRAADVARKVPGVDRIDPKTLTLTFIAAWTMQMAELPLATPPAIAPGPERELYDLGRVRWSRDQNDFVWWLPLWHHDDPRSDARRPDGPTDRPFAVGADPTAATWHTGRPAVGVSPDWHAAVLASPAGEVFLVDQGGVWRQPIADVASIIATRSAAMEALHNSLAQRHDIFEANDSPSVVPKQLPR